MTRPGDEVTLAVFTVIDDEDDSLVGGEKRTWRESCGCGGAVFSVSFVSCCSGTRLRDSFATTSRMLLLLTEACCDCNGEVSAFACNRES